VHHGGAFKIHLRAETLAGSGGRGQQRFAAGPKEFRHASGFSAVFVFADGQLTGAQAAAHFAIHAAGVVGGGGEIFQAAAELEEIEKFGFEQRGGGAAPEGSEVDGLGAAEMRGDVSARKGVGQHQFDVGRQAEADFPAIIGAQMPAREFPEKEMGFEPRAGEAILDPLGRIAQVQHTGRLRLGAQKTLQTAAQDVGAGQIRLPLPRPEKKDGRLVGNGLDGLVKPRIAFRDGGNGQFRNHRPDCPPEYNGRVTMTVACRPSTKRSFKQHRSLFNP